MTKNIRKADVKAPKIVGEKRNFSPFRTAGEIADLVGHLTMTWKEESFQSEDTGDSPRIVLIPFFWSFRQQYKRFSNLSECEGAQTSLIEQYDV